MSYTNQTDTRYKSEEKERDLGTNYDYFGARYYDSELGRWQSVDPLASKHPGITPYSYVSNNPLTVIDPDGKDEFLLTWLPKGDAVGHSAVAIQERDKFGNLTGNIVVRHLWPEGGEALPGNQYGADYKNEVIKQSDLASFQGGEGRGADGIMQITGDANQDRVMSATLDLDEANNPKYELGKNDCANYAKGAVESVGINGGTGAKVSIVGSQSGITYKSLNLITPGSVYNAVAGSNDSRVNVLKPLPNVNGNPNLKLSAPDRTIIKQLKSN